MNNNEDENILFNHSCTFLPENSFSPFYICSNNDNIVKEKNYDEIIFENKFNEVFLNTKPKFELDDDDMNLYHDYEISELAPVTFNKVKLIQNNDPIYYIKYSLNEEKMTKKKFYIEKKPNKNSPSKFKIFTEINSDFFLQKYKSNKVILCSVISNYHFNPRYFNVEKIEEEQNNNPQIIIGKKRKKRKYKPDDIRKKIKARFHKTLKNIINENLKQSGSKEFFDLLPQSFISNISRAKNNEVLNMKYRKILEKDFSEELKDLKQKKIDHSKFEKNMKVLKYLDDNPEISKKSGFTALSSLTYKDILREYFSSQEFINSIEKLKQNENKIYIQEYIEKSKKYIEFFDKFP